MSKKYISLSLSIFMCLNMFAQSDSIVEFKNYKNVWKSNGFSQAAIINLGSCKMIMISGQVPLDSSGSLIGKDDFVKQTNQVFVNIKNIITNEGGTMSDVVKLSAYLKDISQLQAFRAVRDKFINIAQPPASTLVEAAKMFRDDIMLEVDATAIIHK